jgi:two-component system, cell cycle sensor histidine kinase and response regulator CckA
MRYFQSALLLLVTLFIVSQSWASYPDIVIINSYHYGQEWSDRELTGVLEVLREKYPNKLPSVEYLDAKRYTDKEHLQTMAYVLTQKYAGKKIDVVIALDNTALDLLLAIRQKVFPGVPIVFAGINNYHTSMLKGQPGITGIAEVTDIKGSIELILKVNPGTKRIIILHDYTTTGLQAREEIEPGLDPFRERVVFSFLPPMTFEEIQKEITSLPDGSAVLNLSFVTDRAGKTLTLAESTPLFTSGNRIPFYSPLETLLGHGVIGGNMRSGKAHGRKAGEIAIRVLNGEDPASIPVDTIDHSTPMFDYQVMTRLGVSPERLPAGSVIINQHPSFFETHKTPLLYALGIILLLSIAIIILSVNIMKRKRAEKKILELNQYTSALFEEARDTIFVTDIATGIILDANRAAEKLMKRPKSELIGLHQSKLYASNDGVEAFKLHVQGLGNMVALEILNKEGKKTPVEISSTVMEFPDGKRFLKSVFRDISERNKLQGQLLHSQKMEAIGTLAGGVAHEFNNVLTAVIGAADMLRMALGKQSSYAYLTEIILKSSDRAARLTQSLLSFCRKDIATPRHLDINELIVNNGKLLSKLIGEDILIFKELSKAPCIVFADPGQIEQIIMNIVLNAKDAMPNGGRLEISTKVVRGREIPEETPDAVREADYVLMSFKDTGCGILPEIRAKIFEPFFTTKEVGKGTGLGLSIVYGIVLQNNGFIDIRSKIGKGTEFRIFLPFETVRLQVDQTESRQADKQIEGTGNVLLAEDDEMLMTMQSLILEAAGYKVFEARDGHEAIEIFRKRIDGIDFVVLDVVMPGMNGKEVYDEIRKLRPAIKILLVSGHTDDFITAKGIIQDKVDFLAKPFTPAQLQNKIREMMHG